MARVQMTPSRLAEVELSMAQQRSATARQRMQIRARQKELREQLRAQHFEAQAERGMRERDWKRQRIQRQEDIGREKEAIKWERGMRKEEAAAERLKREREYAITRTEFAAQYGIRPKAGEPGEAPSFEAIPEEELGPIPRGGLRGAATRAAVSRAETARKTEERLGRAELQKVAKKIKDAATRLKIRDWAPHSKMDEATIKALIDANLPDDQLERAVRQTAVKNAAIDLQYSELMDDPDLGQYASMNEERVKGILKSMAGKDEYLTRKHLRDDRTRMEVSELWEQLAGTDNPSQIRDLRLQFQERGITLPEQFAESAVRHMRDKLAEPTSPDEEAMERAANSRQSAANAARTKSASISGDRPEQIAQRKRFTELAAEHEKAADRLRDRQKRSQAARAAQLESLLRNQEFFASFLIGGTPSLKYQVELTNQELKRAILRGDDKAAQKLKAQMADLIPGGPSAIAMLLELEGTQNRAVGKLLTQPTEPAAGEEAPKPEAPKPEAPVAPEAEAPQTERAEPAAPEARAEEPVRRDGGLTPEDIPEKQRVEAANWLLWAQETHRQLQAELKSAEPNSRAEWEAKAKMAQLREMVANKQRELKPPEEL